MDRILGLGKEISQDPAINSLERMDVRDANPFIDFVHAVTHKTKFNDRAMVFDKSRIRGAAGG